MARLIFLLTIASLLGLAAPVGAEPLGRLFFSPDERAMLDQQRQKGGGDLPSILDTPTEHITLNGLVRRSSGKTTVWINRLPQHENENPQGVVIRQEKTAKPSAVLLLPSGKQVQLKAGQTLDIARDKVREGYEDASLPPPPEVEK